MCFSEHTPHVLLLLSKRVLFLKLVFNKCLESFTLMSIDITPYHHLGKLLVVLLVHVCMYNWNSSGRFFSSCVFLFVCFVENIAFSLYIQCGRKQPLYADRGVCTFHYLLTT